MKKEKSLAKKENQSIATPDYIKGSGRGLNNIDKADMLIPRVMLIQPLSPAKMDKGIPEGNLMNSLTSKDYGSSIVVIPILHSKGRICWQDRDLGGGVLCASDDSLMPRSINDAHALVKKLSGSKKDPVFADCAGCPLKDWGDTEPPKCSLYNQFAILIEGDASLSAIVMDKTKTKIAKKWLSMMVQSGAGMDIFSRKYKISTRVEKKDKFTYYNLDVEPAGFPSEKEYKIAEGLFESFKNTKLISPEE
jgi:hypothetical protein